MPCRARARSTVEPIRRPRRAVYESATGAAPPGMVRPDSSAPSMPSRQAMAAATRSVAKFVAVQPVLGEQAGVLDDRVVLEVHD